MKSSQKQKDESNKKTPANENGYETLADKTPDGQYTLSLLISGAHCAHCIQKIESTLQADKNIEAARLNFSTRRLNIVWNGVPANANEYVQSIENLGYGVSPYYADMEKSTAENEDRFLLLCLGVAGFAMGNVMMLSIGLWSSNAAEMGEATRTFLHWISALIAVPAIMFSGRPFFRSALAVLKQGRTNMDVPISLGLILATGMSIFETIDHGEHVYFESAVMLMFFLLIGRYLDFRAKKNAKSAATDLLQTLAGFASVLSDGKTQRVMIRDLKPGMDVLVAAGEKIPVDGTVETGESAIDTALVTGETLPKNITPGQEVFAGTMNLDAPLTIKAAKAAEQSLLADIVRLMEKAEQGQAQYVRLADKAARSYTPVVHVLAALAFILWFGLWGAEWQDALLIAVTVLIITCPCALGLAVPVVQVLATGLLMKRGVLVKSGDALERLANIDTVFFDKTGTLTKGQPHLNGSYDQKALQLAASLASHSAHPLSKALTKFYDGDILAFEKIKEHPGKGLEGVYKKQKIKLGSRKWCGDKNASQDDTIELWLNIDGEPATCFHFEDVLKDDTHEALQGLRDHNLNFALVSGDREKIVEKLAGELGIAASYAEQTPTEKFAILENTKKEGHAVLMVGDGLNDAPVLSGADVSMAPGSAVDMAQNAADIVFMGDKLAPVSMTYKVARMTQKLVKQNFALSIGYNFIAVPLAFAGLVTPMVAAIAMSLSSLIVIANSYRLKFTS